MAKKYTDYLQDYLDAAEVLHYGTNKEFDLLLFGSEKRSGISEKCLPYLYRKGKLKRTNLGKQFVYMPRRVRNTNEMYPKLKHYVECARCLARIWRSMPEGEIIPEREFFGLGCIPEWAIWYPGGTILPGEFCTESNYRYGGLLRGKIDAYQRHLPQMEAKFGAEAVVLFVIDMPRETVINYVATKNALSARSASLRHDGDTFPSLPLRFVDYKTFLSVPIGTALQSKIYIYANGEIDSLV